MQLALAACSLPLAASSLQLAACSLHLAVWRLQLQLATCNLHWRRQLIWFISAWRRPSWFCRRSPAAFQDGSPFGRPRWIVIYSLQAERLKLLALRLSEPGKNAIKTFRCLEELWVQSEHQVFHLWASCKQLPRGFPCSVSMSTSSSQAAQATEA